MNDCTSSTPLVKKLGIKADCRLLLMHEPDDFLQLLAPMPENVDLDPPKNEPVDVVVLFVKESSVLRKEFPRLKKRLLPAGGLWIAYPKKASKVPTDVVFEVVQGLGLELGLVDNKVSSIDEIWTGLRFVYRKVDR